MNDCLFDRFKVLTKIGEGGQGGVYQAEEIGGNRTVAIKELQFSMISPSEADESFHRFKNEAELSLHHRNIVESVGLGACYGEKYLFVENTANGRKLTSNDREALDYVGAQIDCDGAQTDYAGTGTTVLSRDQSDYLIVDFAYRSKRATFYFAMEYVKGKGLDQILDKGRSMPLKRSVSVISEIASALAYAHRQCVIHRDVKPSNILIDDASKQAKLTDFGIACFLNRERRTALGVVMGSVWYMSPEQVRGETRNVEKTSDIFSLGTVFYEMVTGQKPFTGTLPGQVMIEIVMNNPAAPGTLHPGLPAHLDKLIMHMLQKEPANRPPDMHEVLKRLQQDDGSVERFRQDDVPSGGGGGRTGALCPHCGGGVAATDRFCISCGKQILSECKKCSRSLRSDDYFCVYCGARVGQDADAAWELYVEKGSMEGQVFTINGDVTKIGRMIGGNDVELPTDPTISRYHARVYRENDAGFSLEGWDWINQREPTNGTYVNGTMVSGSGTRIPLRDRDTIRLGDTFLVIRLSE